jgi:hypothetical protein
LGLWVEAALVHAGEGGRLAAPSAIRICECVGEKSVGARDGYDMPTMVVYQSLSAVTKVASFYPIDRILSIWGAKECHSQP